MLVTPEYAALQRDLHRDERYGVASVSFAPIVARVLSALGLASVSDYGAGKQRLLEALRGLGAAVEYHPYDPAFPEYGPARPADLVCCIDVLEHVEPECLEAVLSDLQRITVRFGLFTVHTGPARKQLADGRNAHLIQQPQAWWLERLAPRFAIRETRAIAEGFMVLVEPRAP